MRRWIGGLLVLVLLGALGYWAYPLLGPLLRYGALPKALSQPLTLLVQGVSPEYSGHHTRRPEDFRGHADTLVLLHLDPARKQVVALSIPRDTYTAIPGYGVRKINEANYRQGPQLSMQTVANLVQVPINAYISISTNALREGIDAIGGVEVCIDKPLQYRDTAAKLNIDLQPGCQRLNGEQAEGYLRFRKDALGDIGRIQRQQSFFQSLRDQLTTPAGLAQLPRLVAALEANTQTNLSRDMVAQMLGFALSRPALVGLLLPGGFGGGWQVDEPELRRVVNLYFKGGSPDAVGKEALRGKLLSIVYTPDQFDQASQMRSAVRALGMRVMMREADAVPPRTEVLSNGTPELAQALANELNLPWRTSGEVTLGADLMLRIGKLGP